jgi:hypothetical protein
MSSMTPDVTFYTEVGQAESFGKSQLFCNIEGRALFVPPCRLIPRYPILKSLGMKEVVGTKQVSWPIIG